MRRWLSLLLFIAILATLPIYAYAHPGRTDAKGGHWNRSTGEYHYHHGYSAHDHYDMNGDGVADCPYDFNDRTKSNDTSSASSHYGSVSTGIATEYQSKEVIKEVPYTPPLMKFALGISIFMIVYLVAVILVKNSEIARTREANIQLEIELHKQKEKKPSKLDDMIYR